MSWRLARGRNRVPIRSSNKTVELMQADMTSGSHVERPEERSIAMKEFMEKMMGLMMDRTSPEEKQEMMSETKSDEHDNPHVASRPQCSENHVVGRGNDRDNSRTSRDV